MIRFVFLHGNMGMLKAETRWDETWGYDLNYYAKIFNFAHKNGIRLIGINVPIQVAKLVSQVGYDKIPKELKSLLPELDLSVQSHRNYFINSIKGSMHDGGNGDTDLLDRMYQTQTLWDEYMSESVSNYAKLFPKSKVVVIAGLGHGTLRLDYVLSS